LGCIVSIDRPHPFLCTRCLKDKSMSAQESDPLVSIIMVSYNTREMTLECLRSVVAETTVPYELLVMDNNSTDGSAEAIAAEFPDIRCWAETENHGFAKSNNLLCEHAKGEYVLLLNPDTIVLDGAIDKLMAFAQARPEAKIWGGKTLFGDRSLNPSSCWGRMTLWNVFCRTAGLTAIFKSSTFFNGEAYGTWDRSDERQIDIVSGCFFLIKRAMWDALDGFDLSFVMYGEEADLCLRATDTHGARPRVTPEAVIVHYGGASETVRADKMIRLMRAKITLINRHFPKWQQPIARGLYALWPWSRAVAMRLSGRARKSSDASQSSWAEIWARRDEWKDGYSPLS